MWSRSFSRLFVNGWEASGRACIVRPKIEMTQTDGEILKCLELRGWPPPPFPLDVLREALGKWTSLSSAASSRDSKTQMWNIEKEYFPLILSIPNALDPETPLGNESLTIDPGEDSTGFKLPLEGSILHSQDESPGTVYLEGSLPELELDIIHLFHKEFTERKGFHPILGPDFVKSFIPEGLYDSTRPIPLVKFEDVLLVGGASLHSLLSFFVKNVLMSSSPKFISSGRVYDMERLQRTAVSFMTLNHSQDEAISTRQMLTKDLIAFYSESLGISLRADLVGAANLAPGERHRINFFFRERKVAEIVTYGDYTSKRLSVMDLNGLHLHLVGGYLVDVSSLIEEGLSK